MFQLTLISVGDVAALSLLSPAQRFSLLLKNGWAQAIKAKVLADPDAYSDTVLVIHNIDGPGLRDEVSQSALSIVATVPNVRLVATIDHVSAAAMWDQVEYYS